MTNCCEMRAPTSVRFAIDGDQARGESGGMSVLVRSISTDSAQNALFEAIDQMGGGSITYESNSSQWAVKSGFLNDSKLIYYVRAEYDRGCGAAGILQVTYPKGKKASFSGAVTTMSKSFRADLCG